MRLPAVAGVIPVSLASVEQTTTELHDLLKRIRGRDAARDPALEVTASQTAELAHRQRAGLVAVVEHPDADPALLVAWQAPVDRRIDPTSLGALSRYLAGSGEDFREVTRTETATGYPAVIAERIPVTGRMAGAQLQVMVFDREAPRMAVFTLHSPTGRGWLELAGVAGQFVSGIKFG